MSITGHSLRRPDGPAKVTGAARYSADHSRDGMLHAVLVLARVPRGRLADLDCANPRPKLMQRYEDIFQGAVSS